jgi:sigma-B regulation protein RsbU (phosphoserine phosphatase)
MDARFEVSRLESLLESAKLLNSSLELEAMLGHLLRTAMGRLVTIRGAVAIGAGDAPTLALARGLRGLEPGKPIERDAARDAGLELFFPIGDPAAPSGWLGLGKPARGTLEDGERDFIHALLGLAATSIANASAHGEVVRSNRALDQKIQELRALLDLVRGLAATIEPEEVAQMLVLTMAGRWALRKHGILTWKPGTEPIERRKGLDGLDTAALRAKVEEMAEDALRVGAGDVAGLPPGSVLFRLRSGDATSGVVICGPRPAGLAYTEADLDFGAGMAAQASVALDNAWHFRDTIVRRQLEQELQLAAGIQQDLFPKQMPELAASDLAARNRQARQVGGDYYDALCYSAGGPEQPHLLCVADIAGKGLPASLLMANIQATLRALLAPEASLRAIAARANDLLWASTPPSKYATAFFLRYDPQTGACEYVNGGHCEGVLLRASGEVELLGSTGLPVGLFPSREYDSAEFSMRPGDLLALVSDGVPDACTLSEQEFGMDRLVAALKEDPLAPAASIIERLFARLDEFAAAAPQYDDITVLVLKRVVAS